MLDFYERFTVYSIYLDTFGGLSSFCGSLIDAYGGEIMLVIEVAALLHDF